MDNLSAQTKRKLKIMGGTSILLLGSLYYYKYIYNNPSNDKPKVKSSCCNTEQKSSCCNTEQKSSENTAKQQINQRYSATARNTYSDSDKQKLQEVAKVFGYSVEELEVIGTEANLGLSCGNPVKQANLKKGETVLDLGCGAGMDLFLAKKYIGNSVDGGQLLGVDFSSDMIAKANRNAKRKQDKKNMDISNMKFINTEIENMKDINDNTVDCAISNCVLNLVPNKLNAFKEVYRVLKCNGGRICFSDIALKKELPLIFKNNITSIVNCVGGSILKQEYEKLLYKAGFKNVQMVDKNVNLNIWKSSWESMVGGGKDSGGCCESVDKKESGCCGSSGDDIKNMSVEEKNEMKKLLDETDLNDYVASYYVFGFK